MFLLAIAPVIVIFVVLVVFRRPADITGLIGWVFTALLAWLLFHTGLNVILRASLSGIVASLPVSLVVATSIFQMTLMQKTGALNRLIVLLKTVSRGNQIVQILIINVGVGTLLTALGAVPVSILPPIMLALGYSAFAAIALPAIGYDSLCTYALLGTPIVIFAQFTNQPVEAVGKYFARFMPVVTTLIALGMLWIVGKWRMVGKGLVPTIITGLTAGFIAIGMNQIGLVTLTGIAAGIGVVIVMTVYLLILRQPILDRGSLTPDDLKTEQGMSLARALSPWLFLIVLCLVANEPWIGIKKFLFTRIAMPWNIIPGQPEKLRVFWQAYWWILVSSILSLPFLRATRQQLGETLSVWWKRAAAGFLGRHLLCHRLYHQPLRQTRPHGPGWPLAPARPRVQHGRARGQYLGLAVRQVLRLCRALHRPARRVHLRVREFGHCHAHQAPHGHRRSHRLVGLRHRRGVGNRRRPGFGHLPGQTPERRGGD